MKIVSLNIGEKKKLQWKNKTIVSGIFKYPVKDPIYLAKENVKNDHIEDRKHHGGSLQAVYAYGAQHYQHWKSLYPELDWNFGMFGENMTLEHLDETEIKVGSIYQLGECRVQATKPRQPCYKLGIRFNNQEIVKQFWDSTMSGVYFKVHIEGWVSKGDELVLISSGDENMSIAKMYQEKRS